MSKPDFQVARVKVADALELLRVAASKVSIAAPDSTVDRDLTHVVCTLETTLEELNERIAGTGKTAKPAANRMSAKTDRLQL